MSTNSQAVNPLKDLLDRVNELQRRFEDLEPSIRHVQVRVNMKTLGPRLLTQDQPLWP